MRRPDGADAGVIEERLETRMMVEDQSWLGAYQMGKLHRCLRCDSIPSTGPAHTYHLCNGAGSGTWAASEH